MREIRNERGTCPSTGRGKQLRVLSRVSSHVVLPSAATPSAPGGRQKERELHNKLHRTRGIGKNEGDRLDGMGKRRETEKEEGKWRKKTLTVACAPF